MRLREQFVLSVCELSDCNPPTYSEYAAAPMDVPNFGKPRKIVSLSFYVFDSIRVCVCVWFANPCRTTEHALRKKMNKLKECMTITYNMIEFAMVKNLVQLTKNMVQAVILGWQ